MSKLSSQVLRRLLIGCFAVALCSTNAVLLAQQPPEQTKLRVVLFRFLPDSANDHLGALTERIRREFAHLHPEIALDLQPLSDDTIDLYETSPTVPNGIASLLTKPGGQGGVDVAEIDTVVLGDLIEAELLRPWHGPLVMSDWNPAARKAVTVGSEIYGVPHWLCGHFVFSRNPKLTSVRTSTGLVKLLSSTPRNMPKLVGRLTGSWNVPSLYLDAYADTFSARSLDPGVSTHLDPVVMSDLRTFALLCQMGASNPCTNKSYDDPNVPTGVFAMGHASAMFGYSERLSLIRASAPKDRLYLISAPIGSGDQPLVFTDALVLQRDCTGACEKAAIAFGSYLNSPATQSWIMMSGDSQSGAMPRYLIPATRSAFVSKSVSSDPYYPIIEREIDNAQPFPSFWYSKVHKAMRDRIIGDPDWPSH